MTDRAAILFGVGLFIVLCALTSIASAKIGEPDIDGAVASAIKHHLADYVGMDVIEGSEPSLGPLVLCVESRVPLKIAAIKLDLAETVIEPVPVSACRSERLEGDFGMFTAITKYYDATGNDAAHLKVVGVSCSNTRTCVVDIDDFGAGQRYTTRRDGPVWSVVESQERWVV